MLKLLSVIFTQVTGVTGAINPFQSCQLAIICYQIVTFANLPGTFDFTPEGI